MQTVSTQEIVRVNSLTEWDEATKAVNANELLGCTMAALCHKEAARALKRGKLDTPQIKTVGFPEFLVKAGRIATRNSYAGTVSDNAKLKKYGIFFEGSTSLHYDGVDNDYTNSLVTLAVLAGSTTGYLGRMETFDVGECLDFIRQNSRDDAGLTPVSLNAGDILCFAASGSTKFGRYPVAHKFIAGEYGKITVPILGSIFNPKYLQQVTSP